MPCIAPPDPDEEEAVVPQWAKAAATIMAVTPLPASAYRMALLLEGKDSTINRVRRKDAFSGN